ncbi:Bacteriophage Mu Gp45 protein [compost metagenome]
MSALTRQMRGIAAAALRNVRQALRGVLRSSTPTWSNIGMNVEGLAGEQLAAELLQHYGFTSAPLPGAEVIVIPIGGQTSHGVVVATADGRYRLKVAEGEVALYTDEGDYIHMKRGHLIEVNTKTLTIKASSMVTLDTPLVSATGSVQVSQDVTAGQSITAGQDITAGGEVQDHTRSMQGDRDLYNSHVHGKTPPPAPSQ